MKHLDCLVNLSKGQSKRTPAIFLVALVGITILLTSCSVQASGYYTWPEYNPNIAYDYFDEYGTISPPTMVMDDITNDDGSPVGTYVSGWWCFRWGSDMNPAVTENAWIPMVESSLTKVPEPYCLKPVPGQVTVATPPL